MGVGAVDGGDKEGSMIYEVVMDGGETIRVSCARVDVGMHRGEIIAMHVWPQGGGNPYYMRLPEQGAIAFLRAEDGQEQEVPNCVACP